MSYIFVFYQNKNSSFLIFPCMNLSNLVYYTLQLLKLNNNLIFLKYIALELFYVLYELLHMYGMVNDGRTPSLFGI